MLSSERPVSVDRIEQILGIITNPADAVAAITANPDHAVAIKRRLAAKIAHTLEASKEHKLPIADRLTALKEDQALPGVITDRLQVFATFIATPTFSKKANDLDEYADTLSELFALDLTEVSEYEQAMSDAFDTFLEDINKLAPEQRLGEITAQLLVALYAETAPEAVLEVLTNDKFWGDGKLTPALAEAEIIELTALPEGTPATTTPDAATTAETGAISPIPEAAPELTKELTPEQKSMLDAVETMIEDGKFQYVSEDTVKYLRLMATAPKEGLTIRQMVELIYPLVTAQNDIDALSRNATSSIRSTIEKKLKDNPEYGIRIDVKRRAVDGKGSFEINHFRLVSIEIDTPVKVVQDYGGEAGHFATAVEQSGSSGNFGVLSDEDPRVMSMSEGATNGGQNKNEQAGPELVKLTPEVTIAKETLDKYQGLQSILIEKLNLIFSLMNDRGYPNQGSEVVLRTHWINAMMAIDKAVGERIKHDKQEERRCLLDLSKIVETVDRAIKGKFKLQHIFDQMKEGILAEIGIFSSLKNEIFSNCVVSFATVQQDRGNIDIIVTSHDGKNVLLIQVKSKKSQDLRVLRIDRPNNEADRQWVDNFKGSLIGNLQTLATVEGVTITYNPAKAQQSGLHVITGLPTENFTRLLRQGLKQAIENTFRDLLRP